MRTAKFSAEKIVRLLHEATAGTAVTEVCRRHRITATTFYRWRQKYDVADEIGDARWRLA